jgi:hypothetical protein
LPNTLPPWATSTLQLALPDWSTGCIEEQVWCRWRSKLKMKGSIGSNRNPRRDWYTRYHMCCSRVELLVLCQSECSSPKSRGIGGDWKPALFGMKCQCNCTDLAKVHWFDTFTSQSRTNRRTRTSLSSPHYELHNHIGCCACFRHVDLTWCVSQV